MEYVIKNNKNLPTPLMMTICGSTGSGKTHLLMKMLLTNDFLDYNNLIIFTPTQEQKPYLLLKYGFQYRLSKWSMLSINDILNRFTDDQIEIVCKTYIQLHPDERMTEEINITFYENLNDLPSPTNLNKRKKNLIIFDDCVEIKNQTNISSYFTRGRHNNCSCIYLSQRYYDIPKIIRTQLSAVVLFKMGLRDKQYSFNEHVETFIDDRQEYYRRVNEIWKTKYNYVYINKLEETLTKDIFDD